jgi:hypothetical protein
MAETVMNAIDEYKIAENKKYMRLDNPSLNNTYIEEILKQLDIDNTKEQRRLRYLGHIINLTAKPFLFGVNADACFRKRDNQ